MHARDKSEGRALALQYLFSADLSGLEATISFTEFATGEGARGNRVAFARDLVQGVLEHVTQLDALIGGFARNWRIERMAAVDRNVLRIGAYELVHRAETPVAVAIDEAVELAKSFGSESSGSFVNGILDRIARTDEVRAPRRAPPPSA